MSKDRKRVTNSVASLIPDLAHGASQEQYRKMFKNNLNMAVR